jgi:hypothetical protein
VNTLSSELIFFRPRSLPGHDFAALRLCCGGGGGSSSSSTESNPITVTDKGQSASGSDATTVGEGSIGVGAGGHYQESGSVSVAGSSISSTDSHNVSNALDNSGNTTTTDSHSVSNALTDSGNTTTTNNITTTDNGAISAASLLAGKSIDSQSSAFKDALSTLAGLASNQSNAGSTLFQNESDNLKAMIQAQADASYKETSSVNSLVAGVLGNLKDTTATVAAGQSALGTTATATTNNTALYVAGAAILAGLFFFSSKK